MEGAVIGAVNTDECMVLDVDGCKKLVGVTRLDRPL